jgi:predicted Zn-ribbon and HTH transcriptional regulator
MFILDKDYIENIARDVPGTDIIIELEKDEGGGFYILNKVLIDSDGGGTAINSIPLTKEELRAVWDMLTDRLPIMSIEEADAQATDIIGKSAKFFGITVGQLTERTNRDVIVRKRKIIAYILRQQTPLSLKMIADMLGYRNHATVLHHIKRARIEASDTIFKDDLTKKEYFQLLNHLNLKHHDKKTNETNGH